MAININYDNSSEFYGCWTCRKCGFKNVSVMDYRNPANSSYERVRLSIFWYKNGNRGFFDQIKNTNPQLYNSSVLQDYLSVREGQSSNDLFSSIGPLCIIVNPECKNCGMKVKHKELTYAAYLDEVKALGYDIDARPAHKVIENGLTYTQKITWVSDYYSSFANDKFRKYFQKSKEAIQNFIEQFIYIYPNTNTSNYKFSTLSEREYKDIASIYTDLYDAKPECMEINDYNDFAHTLFKKYPNVFVSLDDCFVLLEAWKDGAFDDICDECYIPDPYYTGMPDESRKDENEEVALSFCRFCGKRIPEDSVFCQFCGKRVK